MQARIIIGGGTSFIGRELVKYFLKKGIPITVIGRSKESIETLFGKSVQAMTWDEYAKQGLEITKDARAVINFASANILEKTWTEEYKREMIESRVNTIRIISNICATLGPNSPPFLFSSAVNIYGMQKENPEGLPERLTEDSPLPPALPKNGFLVEMNHRLEEEGFKFKNKSNRIIAMRLGPVLDKKAGPLPKMALPFRYWLGGTQGSGNQPVPWITLYDTIRAIEFIINEKKINGPVNIVAPGCVPQKEFAKSLGEALNVPTFIWTPGFLLKPLGPVAEELFLKGQHIYPQKLLDNGFPFEFSSLDSALQFLYTGNESISSMLKAKL